MWERAHVLKSGVSVFFCTKNLTFCAFTIYCNKVFAIFLFFRQATLLELQPIIGDMYHILKHFLAAGK